MAARTPATPVSVRARGYPIWYWLQNHSSFGARDLQSLLAPEDGPDQCLDGFVSFLKKQMTLGCLCVSPKCLGCGRSGQDVLLFVHLLGTHLRSSLEQVQPQLILKLLSFSKECRVPAPKQNDDFS